MDGSGGAPAEPGGAVTPPAAFFGLWPKFADDRPEAAPRLVAMPPARTPSDLGGNEAGTRAN